MNATTTEPCKPRGYARMSLDPREDRVLALSLAYLRTGMSAEDAIDSALADFTCAYLEDDDTCPR